VPDPFHYFALIPAGGFGVRLGMGTPKQYAMLGRRTMLEHALDAVLADTRVERAFAVVAPGDANWKELDRRDGRVEFLAVGGSARADSVRNGLLALADRYRVEDRVLVHDAARPCLGKAELARLIDEAGTDEQGGLLAMPLTDTLKRADGGRVAATIDRATLWRAQTPQLFPFGALRAALSASAGDDVTDEASAMERAGYVPRLVEGSASNLKVTTAEDLILARAVLAQQGRL
jgi:2-C-methyl-D-erythritol 4-phosphate cytidylyltransferase